MFDSQEGRLSSTAWSTSRGRGTASLTGSYQNGASPPQRPPRSVHATPATAAHTPLSGGCTKDGAGHDRPPVRDWSLSWHRPNKCAVLLVVHSDVCPTTVCGPRAGPSLRPVAQGQLHARWSGGIGLARVHRHPPFPAAVSGAVAKGTTTAGDS